MQPSQTETLPAQRSFLASFARFGGLSGLGWIVDFTLLLVLVRFAGMTPFYANLISATAAGTLVFVASGKLVFAGGSHRRGLRTAIYIAYTLLVIVAASAAVKYCTTLVLHMDAGRHALTETKAAAIAKIIVTPLNFILNFFVAKLTSEYAAQ
jgi:putative flippase GtrA